MGELKDKMPQKGKVEAIVVRAEKRVTPSLVEQVGISVESGIQGDHYSGKNKKRQVTLIQQEHLQAVASILGKTEIDPRLTRRNIVVSGINLNALKDARFRIGSDLVLETTGWCHPCSRMEENLGDGGWQAMRGHGGITAKVISDGQVQVGDAVAFVSRLDPAEKLT